MLLSVVALLGSGPEESASQSLLTSRMLTDVVEVVLQQHIDPPTRQQLVLETLRAASAAVGTATAGDLSLRISNAENADVLYKLLSDELRRLYSPNDPQRELIRQAALQRLSEVIPGGLRVIPKKDYLVNEQIAANRYVGIGIQVRAEEKSGEVAILKTIDGGTAQQAGILDGDVIVSVEGMPTAGVPLNEVVDWLRGPENTVVRVTIRTGAEAPRELEIPRRIVPFRTVHVRPQSASDSTVLIGLDRITSSSVHELRTILSELSPTVTTVILDFRQTESGTEHHLHLLADALIDDGSPGSVQTRTTTRELPSEPGTLFDHHQVIFAYRPGASPQTDWLAAVVSQEGHRVFRDEYSVAWSESPKSPGMPASFPVCEGEFYAEFAAARLLTADGKRPDSSALPGQALMDTSAAQTVWNGVTGILGFQAPSANASGSPGNAAFANSAFGNAAVSVQPQGNGVYPNVRPPLSDEQLTILVLQKMHGPETGSPNAGDTPGTGMNVE